MYACENIHKNRPRQKRERRFEQIPGWNGVIGGQDERVMWWRDAQDGDERGRR